jgi:hypothetical protein
MLDTHELRLMLDTPLMLWELSVTEQRYRAVLEVIARVPVTEGWDITLHTAGRRRMVNRISSALWGGRERKG